MKQYDAIIIGFGKGGKLLAAELANRNWKVAIIERSSQMYGGTCVNAGCIPTKTLIHESEQAEWLYRDNYDSQAKFYTSAVSRKNKLVSFLRDKNHEHLKSYPNITLLRGVGLSEDLWLWHEEFQAGKGTRRDGLIILQDRMKIPVKTWSFSNGLPVRWSGPALKAGEGAVAIESIEIAHEKLTLLASPGQLLASVSPF